MLPVALTIAGSDPSGGAGLQADLKTFHQFGVYGEAVVTLLTVQNTRGVHEVVPIAPDLIARQIQAVLDDIPPAAIKIGALGPAEAVESVAATLKPFLNSTGCPLVLDPVMAGTQGKPLLEDTAANSLQTHLSSLSTIVTPNLKEASVLAGFPVTTPEEMRRAAEVIHSLGARNVLVKGGHLDRAAYPQALDLLLAENGHFTEYASPWMESSSTHGTGCTLAATIAAELAHGTPLSKAIRSAKRFVQHAIRSAPGLGSGNGPLNHFATK